jgi:hypothetical protein
MYVYVCMYVRTCSGFWGLLDSDGYVLNWNGQRSPVVHQVIQITLENISNHCCYYCQPSDPINLI